MVVIDRTGLEIYWRCPKAFFWGRRFLNGTPHAGLEGLVGEHRIFGTAMHEIIQSTVTKALGSNVEPMGLALEQAHAVGLWMDQQLAHLPDQSRLEYISLLQGLAVLFVTKVLPPILQDWDIVAIEQEMLVAFGPEDTAWSMRPLGILVTPDLVLRRKGTKTIIYWEWKTSGYGPDSDATDKWDKAPQLQIGMEGVRQVHGQCDGAVVAIVHKGRMSGGMRHSPFCYGYTKGGQVSVGYKAGWSKTPVAQILHMHDLTLIDWFNLFDEETWYKLHWTTGFLTPSPFVVERLHDDAKRIANRLSAGQESFLPAWSACEPMLMSPCEFIPLCHTPAGAYPLATFKARVPHHALEPPSTVHMLSWGGPNAAPTGVPSTTGLVVTGQYVEGFDTPPKGWMD